MVCAILVSTLLGMQSGTTATKEFSYTGVPYLEGDGSASVAVPAHSATIELLDPYVARVSTTTVFKNTSAKALSLMAHIPWRIAEPRRENATAPRTTTVVWDGKTLLIARPMIFPPVDTVFPVTLEPGTTHSLKATVEHPTGATGLDFKERIVGYALTGNQAIAQLNITYRYVGNLSGNTTFRLPKPDPAFPWSVGDHGAFVRLSNYQPKGVLTSIRFYPGGFEDIGK